MTSVVVQVLRRLTKSERWQLGGIVGLIFLGMILEMLSLSLILPLVGLVTREDYSIATISWLPQVVKEFDQAHLLQIALGAFVGLYAFKSTFLLWSNWIQKSFSARLSTRFSDELFDVYINQPYNYYLNTNSSSLIRKSQNSGIFVGGVIDPSLSLLTDGSVAVALAILLIAVEPLGTVLVLTTFVAATLAFQRFTKRRIRHWGAEKNRLGELQLKILQQSLGGIRDVTLYGRQNFFREAYFKQIFDNAMITRKFDTVLIMPRLWLELITVSSLFLAVVVMNAQDRSLSEIGVALTLYAGAAFRVMPSVNRLVAAFQNLAFSRHLVKEIGDDLELVKMAKGSDAPPIKLNSGIRIDRVSFRYGPDLPWVLHECSAVFRKGRTIGIIGSSGSGKSTLVDLLLGFLDPTKGRIFVDEQDVRHVRISWMKSVGYVPQEIFLLDDTIEANVAFGVDTDFVDRLRVVEALNQARLGDFVFNLGNGLETVIGERGVRMSGGQRQRLGIARALYANPDVLLFDEATSSLDSQTEKELMSEISELGRTRTTIQIAHRLETIRNCDDIFRISDGVIALLNKNERLEVFGPTKSENGQ